MLEAGQLAGFWVAGGDVIPIDDGGSSTSSGDGTDTHTIASQTSSGPDTVLLATWFSISAARTLDSITWNGEAMSVRIQGVVTSGINRIHAAVIDIGGGARSGNIVANFSGNVEVFVIRKLSLANLNSRTPVATDQENSGSGAADLDTLATPGPGGIRVFAYGNEDNGTVITWSPAEVVELSDSDISVYRHSTAYQLGDSGAAVSGNGAASDEVIVGVSYR